MNILEFFDVKNKEHLRAFKTLCDNGMWPEGFLPKNIYFPTLWQTSLYGQLANAYLEIVFKNEKEQENG